MTIKGFGQPRYHELTSDGSVGLLTLQLVYVEGLNFADIAPYVPKLNLGP